MATIDIKKQRAFAERVVVELRNAGFEALWAGGCVRDQLLGLTPQDYDIATRATPDEVRKLFGHKRTIAVGESFGVITVLGSRREGNIEVATFRTDGGYSDGRHPDQVQYSTPEHDAARRDFTINGLFYDPLVGEVRDYVGGQADLEAGIVRAIGAPEDRIAEDKLRMLRAVRFAARFDFCIDAGTLAAMQHHADEIAQVSGERIGAEMRAMLVHPSRARALRLLRESELEARVLPETRQLVESNWQATLDLLCRFKQPSFPLTLAGVLYPLGTTRVTSSIATRWKLANRDVDRADWLLDNVHAALTASTMPWPSLQRLLTNEGAAELVTLAAGVAGEDDSSVRACRAKLALPRAELDPPPLLTGGDLIAAGFTPGPEFSTLLERVRDAQLEGHIESKEDAIARARTLRGT